ncbi:MAG: MATE family efflux transporter [Myxococcota bacterium]
MTESDNPILTGPVLRTFLYYALSSMIGLVALTTLSLVDGVFVGNFVGGEALAAITILVPCFTVLYAIALMFAIGGSVAAGAHIGGDDAEAASDVFSQTILGTVIMASTFALSSYAFDDVLYRLLGAPPELVPTVGEYFDVIRWALIVQLTTMVLYYFVRADGHPVLATTALLVGALGNIALDALFIVYFDMGLAGAAYAVVLSQIAQAAVLGRYFASPERTLYFRLVQRDWSRLHQAMFNGVSEFINEISVGIIFLLLNHLLIARLGVDGVASFTAVNYYIYVSLMLSYGFADALHPLASQNYGARNRQRIRQILRTALACSVGLGVVLSAVLLGFRTSLTGWFFTTEEATVAADAAELVLVIWPVLLVNSTNIILSCYLTAIHQPKPSALVASLRGLVLPAALLLLLYVVYAARAGSSWSFLIALPLAEWATFVVAAPLVYRHRPAALAL